VTGKDITTLREHTKDVMAVALGWTAGREQSGRLHGRTFTVYSGV